MRNTPQTGRLLAPALLDTCSRCRYTTTSSNIVLAWLFPDCRRCRAPNGDAANEVLYLVRTVQVKCPGRQRKIRCRAAWLALCALSALVPGCAFLFPGDVQTAALRSRILPPADFQPPAQIQPEVPSPAIASDPATEKLPAPREVPDHSPDTHAEASSHGRNEPALTLEQAIDLSVSNSPTLEVMRQRMAQAQAGRTVAFAEFLPQAKAIYRPIWGDTNAPGGFVLPTIPTAVGNLAFGGVSEHFNLAELGVQWTLWDFGRTQGRYGQAVSQLEISRLQYERARQTVSFNVTSAYLQALEARAQRVIAQEAVRRAESVLRDARNFIKRGTGIRNDVLRAEVLVAEMRLSQVKARTAEGIAIAALNQAVGINVSAPTQIVDRTGEPRFGVGLAQALQLAADRRDEFGVVLRSIRSARLGTGVAQADFMPRVFVGGVGAHQDTSDFKNGNLVAGGLSIELSLFEGGRRLGKLEGAEAEVRATIAQGKEICDKIAFEVQTAYLLIEDAQQRISLSRTALSAATENVRVIKSLFSKGDATPTEVVDGELAMTRAQEDHCIALYDYQTALARLAYAVGLPVLTDFSAVGGTCHD